MSDVTFVVGQRESNYEKMLKLFPLSNGVMDWPEDNFVELQSVFPDIIGFDSSVIFNLETGGISYKGELSFTEAQLNKIKCFCDEIKSVYRHSKKVTNRITPVFTFRIEAV